MCQAWRGRGGLVKRENGVVNESEEEKREEEGEGFGEKEEGVFETREEEAASGACHSGSVVAYCGSVVGCGMCFQVIL